MSLLGKEVRVTWVDAKMWGSAWVDENIDFFKLPISCSRGLVVRKTKEMILLLQSNTDNGFMANLIGIPMGSVKEIKELE